MKMRAALLRVLVFMLAVAPGGCMGRNLGTIDRSLTKLRAGPAEVEIVASAAGYHTSAHFAPEYRWSSASDHWYLEIHPVVRRDGAPVPVHAQVAAGWQGVFGAKDEARRVVEGLTVESCSDGAARAVWRVRNLPGDKGRGWEIAYLLDRAAVHTTVAGTFDRCQAALAAAPTFDRWLAEQASAPGIIRFAFEELGRERDALRAILRSGLQGSLSVPTGPPVPGQPQQYEHFGPFNKKVRQAVAQGAQRKPDLEAALYEVLAPDPPFDRQQWDESNVLSFLYLAPDAKRKRAFLEQMLAYCGRTERPVEWRLAATAYLIGRSHDEALAKRGIELAAGLLARPGPEQAAAALVVAKELVGCCESSPDFAALMRAGLGRRSAPEVKLASPDALAYEVVDPDCQDRSLATDGGRTVDGGLCRSFPRFAGSWLARHLDDAALAAARAAIAGRQPSDFDPRTDMVLDGALRVLARDPQAFEQAIAAAPDEALTPAMADATGKKNLRRIYLGQQK